MQSENVYIGDDKFKNFLNHYKCPTDIYEVKLKFAGAICSPNVNLRPTDVISSLFQENMQPRLETKDEANLFFKFFMGLWDEMFVQIRNNELVLPKALKGSKEDLILLCNQRSRQIECGFVEGFWGGLESLDIPSFAGELINSLSDLAEAYYMLANKIKKMDDINDEIFKVIINMDKKVNEIFSFLIIHLVLPKIDELKKQVN
ncbi:MAG: hypothetical protein IKW58_00970 [Alphaproteobacteria bacterium]|nr:hypothetical protein [Alphaproteobacteria bacterium]